MKKILLITLLLAPCAQAIIAPNHTAQPVGTGHGAIQSGFLGNLHYLQAHYGYNEKSDIGITTDFLRLGLDLRYRCYKNNNLSIGLNHGVGGTFITSQPYIYFGSTLSYLKGSFESYVSARATYSPYALNAFRTTLDPVGLAHFIAGINYLCAPNLRFTYHISTLIDTKMGRFSGPYLGAGFQLLF